MRCCVTSAGGPGAAAGRRRRRGGGHRRCRRTWWYLTYSQLVAPNVITAGVIVITTCDITIDATADGVAVVAVIAMRLVTSPSLCPSA